MRSWMCTALCLTLFAGCASAQSEDLIQADLFRAGDGGVHSYRIPALVQGTKGTLIAIADARYDAEHDLPGHIALAMRRSFDGGTSWTSTRIIMQPTEGGAGDASLLLDRRTGRIWCLFAYGPPGVGFSTAKAGAATGPQTLQIHAMHTDDEGETWSVAVDLTPQIKDPSWQAVFATSGTSIQTRTGRLLAPIVVRDGKGVIHSANIFSDDAGRTWHVGIFIGDGTDESHTVELHSGVIMQNMRNGSTRVIVTSKDGGVTFGSLTHDAALIDPGCNAGITRYQHGATDVLLFTNAASRQRRNLTVRLSLNEGSTWPVSRVLQPGPAAYSTVVALKDGSIGVLYERGEIDAAEKVTFARFPLKWLIGSPSSH